MMPIEKSDPVAGKPWDPKTNELPSGSHRQSPGRSSLVVILAIAAVGVTGAALYAFIGYPGLRPRDRAGVPGDGSNAVGARPPASPPARARPDPDGLRRSGQGRNTHSARDPPRRPGG